ncbi:MAG: hypothetical protein QGH12_11675 [SAR324 cluster bacterium]|nr:hypothetical protein [SAR324 cluster bacterium]
MHRHANLPQPNSYFDRNQPDNESLQVQLCENHHPTGFIKNDANTAQLRRGEEGLLDFFEQEAQVVQEFLPRERLQQFLEHLQRFNWPQEQLRGRLHRRIVSAFDRLARGIHHHFNIRRNLAIGLQQPDGHPLSEFLLHVEAYWTLLLKTEEPTIEQHEETEEEEPDLSGQHYSIEDILQLRKQVQERVAARQFMRMVLGDIAKQRGVTVGQLDPEAGPLQPEERQHERIEFLRPSQAPARPDPKPVLVAAPATEDKVEVEAPESDLDLVLEPDLSLGAEGREEVPLLTPEIEIAEPSTADAMFQEENPKVEAPETTTSEESESVAGNDSESAERTEPSAEVSVEEKSTAPEPAEESEEFEEGPPAPTPTTAAALLDLSDEDIDDDDFEEGLKEVSTDEADVVFGTGPVTRDSLQRYVREYPDSALRFLLRREIDGRLLAREIESVHEQWQERGLVRGRVSRYLLELMSWEEIPDLPIHELLGEVRRHLVTLRVTEGA